MNKKVSILVLSLSLCCASINAQEVQKSELQKNAEAAQTIPAAAITIFVLMRTMPAKDRCS